MCVCACVRARTYVRVNEMKRSATVNRTHAGMGRGINYMCSIPALDILNQCLVTVRLDSSVGSVHCTYTPDM